MASSEAQKKASARYTKNAVTSKGVHFYPKDKELLEFAMSKADKGFGAYVRDLIQKDMEQDQSK